MLWAKACGLTAVLSLLSLQNAGTAVTDQGREKTSEKVVPAPKPGFVSCSNSVLQKALPVREAEEVGLYVALRPGCDVKPRSVPEAFGAQLCSEAASWASPAVLKEWLWQM